MVLTHVLMWLAIDEVLCVAVVAQVQRDGLLPAVYAAAVADQCWNMWQQHVYLDRHHAHACKPEIASFGYLSCRLHMICTCHAFQPHLCCFHGRLPKCGHRHSYAHVFGFAAHVSCIYFCYMCFCSNLCHASIRPSEPHQSF